MMPKFLHNQGLKPRVSYLQKILAGLSLGRNCVRKCNRPKFYITILVFRNNSDVIRKDFFYMAGIVKAASKELD